MGIWLSFVINSLIKIHQFFKDQKIQFPIAFFPILLDLLYEHRVCCKYLDVQILYVIWLIEIALNDHQEMKKILRLF